MDDKWFKQQQKKAGVTADDIARKLGRDRSLVSRIYVGRQKMTLDQARAFAEVLDLPLSEVLEKAGVTDSETSQQISPGFSEGDVTPWTPRPGERSQPTIAEAFGARSGIDIWRVSTPAMSLQGLLPGDYMLVDTHMAERAKAGDVVVAQIYDHRKPRATTILRRYEPPVLVAASTHAEDNRIHMVDGVNVVIMGKVTASWRI